MIYNIFINNANNYTYSPTNTVCDITTDHITFQCNLIQVNQKLTEPIKSDIKITLTKDALVRSSDCSVLQIYTDVRYGKPIITDRYSKTTSTQPSLKDWLYLTEINPYIVHLFTLIIPSKNMLFTEMDVLYNQLAVGDEYKVTSNTSSIDSITKSNGYYTCDFLPKIECASTYITSKDTPIDISARVYWHKDLLTTPIALYPTVDAGYINKTKVMTNNGVATVKITPLLLDSGDTIELKWGFKTFTNALTTTIAVKQ